MFLWFLGTALWTVFFVFTDPRFDYRLLLVGSVLWTIGLLFVAHIVAVLLVHWYFDGPPRLALTRSESAPAQFSSAVPWAASAAERSCSRRWARSTRG